MVATTNVYIAIILDHVKELDSSNLKAKEVAHKPTKCGKFASFRPLKKNNK